MMADNDDDDDHDDDGAACVEDAESDGYLWHW